MHEAGLMRELMAKILSISEREAATRVAGVHVRLGALSHMTPEHFREHFADSAQGTIAEGATLHIEADDDTTAPGAQGIRLEAVDVE